MNSTWAVLWLHSGSSRSKSYGRIYMIGHFLGYLPVSPNHMLALITVTLKTEVTCALERLISPYRSTRCHNPGDEHLTASLARSSCTIGRKSNDVVTASGHGGNWKQKLIKLLTKFLGWCDGGPANVLSPGFKNLQEEILQKTERIWLSEPQQLFVYRTCDVTTVWHSGGIGCFRMTQDGRRARWNCRKLRR